MELDLGVRNDIVDWILKSEGVFRWNLMDNKIDILKDLQNQSSSWKHMISHDGNEGEVDDEDESEDRYEGHEEWGLLNFLKSLELSDVFFIVGTEEKVVPAHKVILGASGSFPISSCNEDSIQILGVDYLILYVLLQYIYTSQTQMFTNGMRESGSSEIFLSDVSLEAFAAMFQFMYHGDIDMNNSMDMVNGTIVVHCGFYSEKGWFKLSEEDKSYMQTCKVVVSTCTFGGGDDLYRPIGMSQASLKKEADGNKINKNRMIGKWRIVIVRDLPFIDQRLNGKIPKMLTHRLFPQARFSIWVDSKSQFQRDPLGVLEALLWQTNSILAISEHGAHSSVYDEAKAVVHKNKVALEEVDKQMT
ncbi:hypothetical protein GIB67_026662 [Kingdonia uniflora]|uniref:BTB domain-containing protein n=1 Tax=Kingdonia uniflora TaxID=39325 RepID=A0A7J7MH04_9MAGN|nr:hypothetical protein GIB67_026662 [Kingdonia uniflora]